MKLFKSKTAADIAAAIEKTEAGLPALQETVAKAEDSRRAAIIEGDASAIAEAERAVIDSSRAVEHASIRLDAFRQEHARLLETEAEADKRRLYDQAQKARAAMMKDHQVILRQMAREAQRLIAESENTTALIQRANENLPAGAKPIPDAELELRGRFAEPEKIVSETFVDRWCHAGTVRQIRDDLVPQVTVNEGNPDRGSIYQRGSGSVDVERRRFRVVRYLPSQTIEWPAPLAADLRVPSLTADQPERTRTVQERWEPITTPAADAA